jgi:peptidoglycan/LPS O-acetylase OafA/YrhL
MTGVVEPRADLPALTGMRGVAAWFVVFYHIRLSLAAALPPEAIAVFAKGYLAVDLFFMLSGFVLWLNYSARIRTEGLKLFPRFIARRIARIWPLHAAMLLAAVALTAGLAILGKPVQAAWGELPLHILMVHNWGFTDRLQWNDPSWSISGEFAAYLLFPFLALAVDWRRLAPETLLALLALLAAILHFVMASQGATLLDHDIPRLGIARALIEFTMGTLLCALWMHWRDGRRLAIAGGGALLALFVLLKGDTAPETALAPALLAALLFVAAVAAQWRGNPFASRPIHYLGLISYSTYLVHFLLFRAFKMVFVEGYGPAPLGLLALFLLLTFAASVALFHGIERPAQRALNGWFDRRTKPAPAPRPAVGQGA